MGTDPSQAACSEAIIIHNNKSVSIFTAVCRVKYIYTNRAIVLRAFIIIHTVTTT